jgi:hypothetical protein
MAVHIGRKVSAITVERQAMSGMKIQTTSASFQLVISIKTRTATSRITT